MSGPPLKIGQDAPFPWFGGKRRVAPIVWRALGDVRGYSEPFAGSLAVLLRRPGGASGVETVNDKDSFIANFWRAVRADPEAVARHADWPVNETDLYARHRWLVESGRERIAALEGDPEHYDAKVAGWWVWGVCCWIGSDWCSATQSRKLPAPGNPGRGVNRGLPHLADPGQGINRQLPDLGNPGRGYVRTPDAEQWIGPLSERLRRVRVACGDWRRVVTPSVLRAGGSPCGVFLDPPYDTGNDNYSVSEPGISAAVREWALSNGDDPRLRIVLCGHEGEHEMPASWYCHAYSATGAYVGAGDSAAQEHRHRERIWFSPHCLPVDLYHASGVRGPLFSEPDPAP